MTSSLSSGPQHYCLRWNNHSSNFITVFDQLLRTEAFCDITISVAGGHQVKCHKMVLAACSQYFQDLFLNNPQESYVLVLSEINYADIKAILDYMYKGEVNIAQDQLPGLLRIAANFKVKGLVDVDEKENVNQSSREEADSTHVPSTSHNSTPNNNGPSSPVAHSHVTSPPHGNSPIQTNSNAWAAFPGLPIPQHPVSSHNPLPRSNGLGGSYDKSSESSPLSRKKSISSLMANRDTPILRNVLGQNHVEEAPMPERDIAYPSTSNGISHDLDRRNSVDVSESQVEEEERRPTRPPSSSHSRPSTSTGGNERAGGHNRPEWKRYKQYTREHITDAMNAVQEKSMSALQAARKYGVPSRTLYDKLKKAGIMPSRGPGCQRRESSSTCSARFPYSGSLNGSVYGNGNGNGNGISSESESDHNVAGPSGLNLADYSVHDAAHLLLRARGLMDPVAAGAIAGPSHIDEVVDMSTPGNLHNRSPSPSMHSVLANCGGSFQNDEVEDLSVRSTSGNGASTSNANNEANEPSTPMDIKEENEEVESD